MMFKEKTKEQTNVKRIVEKYNNITLSLSNYEMLLEKYKTISK